MPVFKVWAASITKQLRKTSISSLPRSEFIWVSSVSGMTYGNQVVGTEVCFSPLLNDIVLHSGENSLTNPPPYTEPLHTFLLIFTHLKVEKNSQFLICLLLEVGCFNFCRINLLLQKLLNFKSNMICHNILNQKRHSMQNHV